MYNKIFRENRILLFLFVLVQAILSLHPIFNNFSVDGKRDGKNIYLLFLVLLFMYYDKCEFHKITFYFSPLRTYYTQIYFPFFF